MTVIDLEYERVMRSVKLSMIESDERPIDPKAAAIWFAVWTLTLAWCAVIGSFGILAWEMFFR